MNCVESFQCLVCRSSSLSFNTTHVKKVKAVYTAVEARLLMAANSETICAESSFSSTGHNASGATIPNLQSTILLLLILGWISWPQIPGAPSLSHFVRPGGDFDFRGRRTWKDALFRC